MRIVHYMQGFGLKDSYPPEKPVVCVLIDYQHICAGSVVDVRGKDNRTDISGVG